MKKLLILMGIMTVFATIEVKANNSAQVKSAITKCRKTLGVTANCSSPSMYKDYL